jgi:hypothetical protein
MPFAVIEEKARADPKTRDQQVEAAIAINIRKNRSGGVLIRAGNSRGFRDVFEFPPTQVSIKTVAVL